MRGRRIHWRGGYTSISGATLNTFHSGLQSTFGFVAVGSPLYQTFGGGGVVAAALYEQAMVTLWSQGDTVTIQAVVRGTHDWTALKQFAKTTFGLKAVQRDEGADYLVTTEDETEL